MHLIDLREQYETQSGDHEVSRTTINGHWRSGREDARASL
jgi:hypothetical protein